MKKKIFSLLVLLMTAVTGAWATITVTWNNNDITGSGNSFTKDGVTITAGDIDFDSKNIEDDGTFTTTLGNFTKIEVTTDFFDASGEGWIGSTWTGNASSVSFSGSIFGFDAGNTKFVFTIEPATVAVTGVTLAPTSATLTLGETETVTLTATVLPGDATDKSVTWSSSDEAVATVADGVVTAVAVGTATITATSNDDATKTATCTVTVSPAAPAATTNYYLVGTMNDWGASKQFLLTPNPGNAAEYMITLNLKADTQLKVIGVEEGKETVWYPSGDNYVVNDAGQYTVYFRPDGQGGEGWHYGCIYLAPAPAPAVPLTDLGSGQWQFQMPDYAVVAKIEYDTELELQEENVNTAVLADWDGYEADITLKRKLVAGSWNTLAVPFNVSSEALEALNAILAQQGGSLTVKKLANTTLSGETILLNFEDAHEIVAGNPYLVKVTKDVNLATLPAALAALGAAVNPFHDAEISKDPVPVQTDYADFIPTLGKTTIGSESDDAKTILFVAAGNLLKNPSEMPAYMKGFRAYFQLKNVPAGTRAFALNIDGEATGVQSVATESQPTGQTYDLQGRKVNAAQKGVYIVNGKKVIK